MSLSQMPIITAEVLGGRAQRLLQEAFQGNPNHYVATIFETAMVASMDISFPMRSPDDVSASTKALRFPEAFKWVLAHQKAHGGWDAQVENSLLDCILNTIAGLLALLNFEKNQNTGLDVPFRSLATRIRKAQEYLDEKLQTWDPESDAHRMSIQLIPRLVKLLRAQKIHVPFLKRDALDEAVMGALSCHETTMALSTLYSWKKDFEMEDPKFEKSRYGIMCSPSATALHMLETGTLDEDYVVYLQGAMEATGGRGSPAMMPANLMEKALVGASLWQDFLVWTSLILIGPRERRCKYTCRWEDGYFGSMQGNRRAGETPIPVNLRK
jgi:hypothetical protein